MLTLTAPLSPYCFPIPGTESPSPTNPITHSELTLACNAYNLLLYVPPEYFSRPVRAELVKRAMAADVQICMALEGAKPHKSITKRKHKDRGDAGRKSHTEESDARVPSEELKRWSRRLTFVRVFLQRMGQFLSLPSHSVSLTFLFRTMLMQNIYEDFLDLCQPSAQPTLIIFLEGTHKRHPRFNTIARRVRSELLRLCTRTLIIIFTSGTSCAHRN